MLIISLYTCIHVALKCSTGIVVPSYRQILSLNLDAEIAVGYRALKFPVCLDLLARKQQRSHIATLESRVTVKPCFAQNYRMAMPESTQARMVEVTNQC